MNILLAFAIELLITILFVGSLVVYFRPYLRRILVDLCGGEERARFWTVFSAILLVGLPAISALSYEPVTANLTDAVFELARQLSRNLMAFLAALIGLGVVISFFALVAPRARTERPS